MVMAIKVSNKKRIIEIVHTQHTHTKIRRIEIVFIFIKMIKIVLYMNNK